MGVFSNWNNNGFEEMGTTMDGNDTILNKVGPTKRQMDEMNMMLDESISPKADWDDPSDVLAWMEESEGLLQDPAFSSLIYRDGKTSGEVMLDMLKEHGYGNSTKSDSLVEQKISDKMHSLENQVYGTQTSTSNRNTTMNTPVLETQQSINLGNEDKDEEFYSNLLDSLPSYGEENTQPVWMRSAPKTEEIANNEPEQQFNSTFTESSPAESKEDTEIDHERSSWMSDRLNSRDNPLAPSDPSSNKEETPEADVQEVESSRPSFFRVQPKEETIVEERAEEEEQFPSFITEEPEEVVEHKPSFFTRQPKEEDNLVDEESIREDFDIPSDNIQENWAVINYAIATRNPEDIARAEEALAALPKEDATTKYFKQQIEQIKQESRQVSSPVEQEVTGDLRAFQQKYGPTANAREMQIVNHLEEEITNLETRRQEIIDRLNVIKEELQNQQVNQGPQTTQVVNRVDRSKIEQALQEVHEMEKNSTRKLRNNEAMPDFYKAVETHQIMDIVRASNAVESLGTNHLFYGSLNNTLNEVANTYYGKTIEGLKVELRETSKEFKEALDLLELDANNQVVAGRVGTLKESFNQIATDRSKERMLTAMDEVQKLGAEHPYAKRLTKALNGMATIYYGKTAEELQRQVKECTKATNEVHEKIEKDKKKEQFLYDDDSKGKGFDLVEALYNKAVLDPTKENILEVVEVTRGLAKNRESTIALNNALTILTETYLDTSLNELKKKDLTQSIENVQKTYAQIPESAPIEDALEDAIMAFNKATQTKEKGDIIVAFNMANKIVENKSLGQNMVDTLHKLSLVHYGVDAIEMTGQFKKYSEALNDVNDMVAPNAKKISEDAKQNEAMPYFYKAIQTRDLEDIQTAIDEVNKLPEYHPLKKPLLDALNAEIALVGKVPNSYILEEEEKIVEENGSSKELQEEATNLINECKGIDEQLNKYNQSLNKYKENKQKEAEELRRKQEKDLEPPQEVISDTTNKNPGLFKKAVAGAKEALSKIKITKKGVATAGSILVDASLIGLSIVTGQGAIPLIAYLGYKYSKKFKDRKNKKKEEQEIKNQDLEEQEEEIVEPIVETSSPQPEVKDDDMTAAIIENGIQAVNERDNQNRKAIQYYQYIKETPDEMGSWQELGNANDARVDIIGAVIEGRPVGYTKLGDNMDTPIEIPRENLEEFLKKNNTRLPSAEEIDDVVNIQLMNNEIEEGMRRGK